MAEKTDKASEQVQQKTTTSGSSTSAQIVGDGNTTIIQQHTHSNGKVVGVHMPTLLGPDAAFFVECVHVNPGGTIQPKAPLVTFRCMEFVDDPECGPMVFDLEDSFTLPSPVAGVVESLHVAVGDGVLEGYLIATVRVWEAK